VGILLKCSLLDVCFQLSRTVTFDTLQPFKSPESGQSNALPFLRSGAQFGFWVLIWILKAWELVRNNNGIARLSKAGSIASIEGGLINQV
jgi:hypothetical protein